MFIGWDWATETHDVTVMDHLGVRVDRWELAHTEEGITKTLARMTRYGAPADLPVAIATTRGLVVDRLLAAGHPVVPVHPNTFHAMRPRWGAAKAKTDAGDSMKLADYLRTDGHFLPRLEPTDQATLNLQALTRPAARRPHRGQSRRRQPARRIAGRPLARRQGRLLRTRQRHSPGLPGALPHPGRRLQAHRRTSGSLVQTPRLLGQEARQLPRRASAVGALGRVPAQPGHRRTARPRPGPTRPGHPCHRPRAGQGHHRGRQGPPLRAAVRDDAANRQGQPRPDHRRTRPHPRTLPDLRAVHRRSRRRPGHASLRQVPHRRLPLRDQPPRTPGRHQVRRQHQTRQRLGRDDLHRRPCPQEATPPRHPHPGPRLAPRDLGLLA
ncbi:transposase [Streptomyces sp. ISL-1]|nr:transposase [Streptomyces sp. ISL-1]